MNKKVWQSKNLVIPSFILETLNNLKLSVNEFLLLIYFWNFSNTSFDVSEISNVLKLDENEILTSFNLLLGKKLISLDTFKDINGKRMEVVNLDNFYMMLDEGLKNEEKVEEKNDVFTIFETEFARPISSMEYEIIKAWLEKGFSEELILGALKEAVYNGVNNLRYIDKILYEWQKKGYKNMKDVSNQNRKEVNEPKELFDYNWLDDNE